MYLNKYFEKGDLDDVCYVKLIFDEILDEFVQNDKMLFTQELSFWITNNFSKKEFDNFVKMCDGRYNCLLPQKE